MSLPQNYHLSTLRQSIMISWKIPHWPIMAHLYNRTNHFAQGFSYINSQLFWPKTSGIAAADATAPHDAHIDGIEDHGTLPCEVYLGDLSCEKVRVLQLQSYIKVTLHHFFPWYNLVQLLQGVILICPFFPQGSPQLCSILHRIPTMCRGLATIPQPEKHEVFHDSMAWFKGNFTGNSETPKFKGKPGFSHICSLKPIHWCFNHFQPASVLAGHLGGFALNPTC